MYQPWRKGREQGLWLSRVTSNQRPLCPICCYYRASCLLEAKPEMTHQDETALRDTLVGLRQEHRDLDTAIAALESRAPADALQIKRLKKRKLHLKDRIAELEDQLTPDIIA
jgi:hypothetical protein